MNNTDAKISSLLNANYNMRDIVNTILVINKERKIYYLDHKGGYEQAETIAKMFNLFYTKKGNFGIISYNPEYMGDNFHEHLEYLCLYQELENYGNMFFRPIGRDVYMGVEDCEEKYKKGDLLPSNGVSFQIFEGNQVVTQLYAFICYGLITSEILNKLVVAEHTYTNVLKKYPSLRKYHIRVWIGPQIQPLSEYNCVI